MKEYEFRTTVVKGLHERGDFEAIARWLSDAGHITCNSTGTGKTLLENFMATAILYTTVLKKVSWRNLLRY